MNIRRTLISTAAGASGTVSGSAAASSAASAFWTSSGSACGLRSCRPLERVLEGDGVSAARPRRPRRGVRQWRRARWTAGGSAGPVRSGPANQPRDHRRLVDAVDYPRPVLGRDAVRRFGRGSRRLALPRPRADCARSTCHPQPRAARTTSGSRTLGTLDGNLDRGVGARLRDRHPHLQHAAPAQRPAGDRGRLHRAARGQQPVRPRWWR